MTEVTITAQKTLKDVSMQEVMKLFCSSRRSACFYKAPDGVWRLLVRIWDDESRKQLQGDD